MPRGPHPKDAELFAPKWHSALSEAAAHLSWLLSRGYTLSAALKLVGDRFSLRGRQREALARICSSDEQVSSRRENCHSPAALSTRTLFVDGFNLLVSVEAALSGAFLFIGRDGCLRDLASVHGSYRRVEVTVAAIDAIGRFLEAHDCPEVRWVLDRPVSNSGRLADLLRTQALAHSWPWEAELDHNPDRSLATRQELTATSDAWILDQGVPWVPLSRWICQTVPEARFVDLWSGPEAGNSPSA